MPRRHVHDGMGSPAVIAFLAVARIEMNKHPDVPLGQSCQRTFDPSPVDPLALGGAAMEVNRQQRGVLVQFAKCGTRSV